MTKSMQMCSTCQSDFNQWSHSLFFSRYTVFSTVGINDTNLILSALLRRSKHKPTVNCIVVFASSKSIVCDECMARAAGLTPFKTEGSFSTFSMSLASLKRKKVPYETQKDSEICNEFQAISRYRTKLLKFSTVLVESFVELYGTSKVSNDIAKWFGICCKSENLLGFCTMSFYLQCSRMCLRRTFRDKDDCKVLNKRWDTRRSIKEVLLYPTAYIEWPIKNKGYSISSIFRKLSIIYQ